MKKFTSLLISCSLALAGAAMAQQPDEQSSPKPEAAQKDKGRGEGKLKANPNEPRVNPNEPKANANQFKPEGAPVERHGAKNGPGAATVDKAEMTPKPEATMPGPREGKHAPAGSKMEKADATPKPEASVATKKELSTEPAPSPIPGVNRQADESKKGAKNPAAAKTTPTPAATTTATAAATATPVTKASATPAPSATASATPAATISATPAATASPSVGTASEQNAKVSPVAANATPAAPLPTPKPNTAAATKKPDEQKVQQIKTEHANFRAQPNPQVAPAVTFNQNYRVEGSDRWQGQQYEVFRSYRPERHDEGYYRSHYGRVELIGGGYYYQHDNYWYPAWGYNPRNEYYAYDGPIYAGHRSEPPDRVIADVQAALQQMGYYTGQVDGLLGPLTRKALLGYQEDAGLTATAAIDEPTLDALGMG